LIGEIVAVVTTAAVVAARAGAERITRATIDEARFAAHSKSSRRRAPRHRRRAAAFAGVLGLCDRM
jgi:hypothetical protein